MERRWLAALLVAVLALLALSGISPRDRATWALEVAAIPVTASILLLTWKRFPLTPLAYWLLALHACILIVGGHYTYAEVPAGDWVRESAGWRRNPYDRMAHLAQGIVPAIVAREILLRKTPLRPGGWLFAIVVSVCLAFSALYELFEWWVALLHRDGARDFLATQGDPWDTQWDMSLALTGSILSQLAFSRSHDRQLDRLGSPAARGRRGSRKGRTSSLLRRFG